MLTIEQDDSRDTLTIEGIVFSQEVFRQLRTFLPLGQPFTLVSRDNNVLSVQRLDGATATSAATIREFTNELGNCIRITIEGPTSTAENVLTPKEAGELVLALNAHGVPPIVEMTTEINGLRSPALGATPTQVLTVPMSMVTCPHCKSPFWHGTTADHSGLPPAVKPNRVQALADEYRAEVAAGRQTVPRMARHVEAERAREAKAREIYDGWKDTPGWVPWVERGNSTKQDEARRIASGVAGGSQ